MSSSKIFMVRDLNPIPWKVATKVKNGNLENYQETLKVLLTENYTEEQRQWPEGPLRVKFYFRRSTTGGNQADLSNVTKATEDAIQDIIIGNDRHNHAVSSEMLWQFPGANPMVIIVVERYLPSFEAINMESLFDRTAPDAKSANHGFDIDVQSYF